MMMNHRKRQIKGATASLLCEPHFLYNEREYGRGLKEGNQGDGSDIIGAFA